MFRRIFNICIKIKTDYDPDQLLKKLKKIEIKLGRKDVKNQNTYNSRTIDLDILFYDNLVVDKKKLTIPHPRVELRNFVLFPLREISKNLVHPISRRTINEIIDLKKDKLLVEKTELCVYEL